jgi:hypothetical protein
MIISLPVHTVELPIRGRGALTVVIGCQVSVTGS